MSVKLLTEHHLELISSKGGCTGSSKSTLAKMPHCWKSHVTAHLFPLSADAQAYLSLRWAHIDVASLPSSFTFSFVSLKFIKTKSSCTGTLVQRIDLR